MRIRKSKRPSKQILWLMLEDVFKQSSGKEVGVDVACGEMKMRPYFKTSTYKGIDIDPVAIEEGLRNNPDAQSSCKQIEDLDPKADSGDFVTCLETLGINSKFDDTTIMKCISILISITNQKGVLVFNCGPRVRGKWEEIESLVKIYFKNVKVKKYGSIHSKLPLSVSYVLAVLFKHLPFLDRFEQKFTLFVCEERNEINLNK